MKITDKITITNEDNMELMARYPDNYFDLAIVDPSEEQREKVLLRQEAEVKEIEVIIEKFECEIFVNG